MNHRSSLVWIGLSLLLLHTVDAEVERVCRLTSPDGLNAIDVDLTEQGCPVYRVARRGRTVIGPSSLGLRCATRDLGQGLTLQAVSPRELRREAYQLLVGNRLSVDSLLATTQVTFSHPEGIPLQLDLVASNEGIAFRYRLGRGAGAPVTVTQEVTTFAVPPSAEAWLQPYHAAGRYTPAYEDFFFCVRPGDAPPRSRQAARGWCLPGLFHVEASQCWLLLAESNVDGSYCGCHLEEDPTARGHYQIAFAYTDEVTGAKVFDADAEKTVVQTQQTPWRVIVLADEARDILHSTLVTDVAAPCQIEDTTWIQTGRASWGWWSHPDGPTDQALFNSFTDLAAEFGWEYTLFDAGWWNTDLRVISTYAENKSVKPLAWTAAEDFFDPKRRSRKLDELAGQGARGIKVDFWCSDRQETMAAMIATLTEAAQRRLVVNFHGCTIPRGWHRTWPNLVTAEAVLGTESYFYESRFPARVAEQNTILPFTRNVMGPLDFTPVALTQRRFARKTTAVHELAAALVLNSGITHYADSVEMYRSLPTEVRRVLRVVPGAWDETRCLIGDPGRLLVLARRTGDHWFIVGLNGTMQPQPVTLDLQGFGPLDNCTAITEGQDPLEQFAVQWLAAPPTWDRPVYPAGGFILSWKASE